MRGAGTPASRNVGVSVPNFATSNSGGAPPTLPSVQPATAWVGEVETGASDWSPFGGDDWRFTDPEPECIHSVVMDAVGSLQDSQG